jgi:hypothetical protein
MDNIDWEAKARHFFKESIIGQGQVWMVVVGAAVVLALLLFIVGCIVRQRRLRSEKDLVKTDKFF